MKVNTLQDAADTLIESELHGMGGMLKVLLVINPIYAQDMQLHALGHVSSFGQ